MSNSDKTGDLDKSQVAEYLEILDRPASVEKD